ncbi:DedA family protein [Halocatena halophila]|uniref:DedA family protein n=1 Tax=Halocatena halophila TaxID=2814576 RepID=UPI002ED088A3
MTGIVATALIGFLHQYGFLALFVYTVLEASFLLHFAPVEFVVPVAAVVLVHDPISFVLFVGDTTLGTVIGSVGVYAVTDRFDEELTARLGPSNRFERTIGSWTRDWFDRFGEKSVLVGRCIPVVRVLISMPAGMAHMDRWRYIIYSTVGTSVFMTALVSLSLLA